VTLGENVSLSENGGERGRSATRADSFDPFARTDSSSERQLRARLLRAGETMRAPATGQGLVGSGLVRKTGISELVAAALVAVIGVSLLARAAHDPDDLPPEQVAQGSQVAPVGSNAPLLMPPARVREDAVPEPCARVAEPPVTLAAATIPTEVGSPAPELEAADTTASVATGIHSTVVGRVLDSRGASAIRAVVTVYGVIASPKDDLRTWTEAELEAARAADEEARRAVDDPTHARSASAATLRTIRREAPEGLLLELARTETGGDGSFRLEVNRDDVVRVTVFFAIRDAIDEETHVWQEGVWENRSGDLDFGDRQLGRSGRLTIAVRDHGHPVAGASAELLGGYGALHPGATKTDADGVVFIETTGASADVLIQSEGFATEYLTVDMSSREVNVAVDLEPTATISGVVCDADGSPIESALVLMREKGGGQNYWVTWGRATTDARGGFKLQGAHPGRPAEVNATPPDGREADLLPSAMVEATPSASGLVLTLGKPARIVAVPDLDADVADLGSDSDSWTFGLQQREGENLDTARTYYRDSRTFSGLYPGTYQLVVSSGEYAPSVSAEVTVAAGEEVQVPIRVTRGRRVNGRVVDARGAPIKDSYIKYRSVALSGGFSGEGCDDADGSFVFERFPPGEVVLEAHGPGYEPVTFRVRDGQTRVPDIVLATPAKD
jgi:hypothetical protein